ncbi:hypothetical protein FACS189443_5230 [Planctomycetales bacterium]|nr:hypothetical protein FACS189443_5230 [Planctomycetales bacterium]
MTVKMKDESATSETSGDSSALSITTSQNGLIICVKAFPGAKRNEVRGVQDGALKVYVTQIPEKGKANEAIRKQIAKSLGLRNSQVELISGETVSLKKFLLKNVNVEELKVP